MIDLDLEQSNFEELNDTYISVEENGIKNKNKPCERITFCATVVVSIGGCWICSIEFIRIRFNEYFKEIFYLEVLFDSEILNRKNKDVNY
jgi:hypothetical protein